MDALTWLALGLIFFVIVLVIYMIVALHMVPGKIARKNKHPQVKAIEICSLMGLIIFPFWMIAMVWANFRTPDFMLPAQVDLPDGTATDTDAPPSPSTPTKPQKGQSA
jgi:hypothetical protein